MEERQALKELELRQKEEEEKHQRKITEEMQKKRGKFAKEQDKVETPTVNDFDENVQLLDEQVIATKAQRNCCTRLVCLVCCCDTSDIGALSNMNDLKEDEIELYQKQLTLEVQRR